MTDQQSQIKDLIAKGKEQGYLTYAEVNDHLPDDIVDPEQIEDIISMTTRKPPAAAGGFACHGLMSGTAAGRT